jgi:hypothetical protein
MWYREALAVRRSLIVYAIVIVAIGAFNAWGAGDSGGIYLSQAIAVATVAASILALVVGTSLGSELGETAHSALMRPISRAGYAWTVFAVNVIALVIAYLGGLVIFVGTYEAAHGLAPIDLRGVSALTAAALPVGTMLAW